MPPLIQKTSSFLSKDIIIPVKRTTTSDYVYHPFPECKKLFDGDEKEVQYSEELLTHNDRKIFLDEYFTHTIQNCEQFKSKSGFANSPQSDLEANFPIAYLLTIHENAEQVFRLLRVIYQPQNVYCIHVDAKSPPTFLQAIQKICQCFTNVFVSSRSVSVIYGHFSRVTADFHCQRDLLASKVNWKYVINMSGQDLPLQNNAAIVKYLITLNGKNDIPGVIPTFKIQLDRLSHRHVLYVKFNKKSKRKTIDILRTKIRKKHPPNNTTIYFGNAYYMATRAFIKHVAFSKMAYKLINWMTDIHCPEEFYWATLQRIPGTPGGTTEVSWRSHVRAIKWKHHAGIRYPPCRGKYRHNICVFGVGDLHWLSKQTPLFANKFSLNSDHIAFKCMEEKVLNRTVSQ